MNNCERKKEKRRKMIGGIMIAVRMQNGIQRARYAVIYTIDAVVQLEEDDRATFSKPQRLDGPKRSSTS
jgi:hypothetical protein